MTVTLFASLFDKSPRYYDAHVILETFKKKSKSTPLVEQIRSTPGKEARDELKKNLPVVLFGGEFSARLDSALKKYSRLVILDFDDCNVRTKREELILLPYIYSVWLSPSGDGLKALVKVATDNHRGHFIALKKEIEGVDGSGVNESRACFVSYDPNLYLNESSEIYTKVVEQANTDEQKIEFLKKWLANKGEAFVQGSRNNFLTKLCGAFNRFGIDKEYAKKVVERDYVAGSDFALREAHAVVESVYKRYADVHGTSKFDNTFSKDEVEDILSTELPADDIVVAASIKADMMKAYDEGIKGGDTTYFPGLDNHFRWMRGETTTLTGIPNGGKSFVLQQLLLFKAVFEKQKFILFSPEQYPPVFFYQELIRALIGKPIEETAPGRMTRQEYERGFDFVSSFFFYLYPKSGNPSPEWTMARAAEGIIKHGADGVIVDPVNSQEHNKKDSGGRDDIYIANMLVKEKNFAIQQNIYFVNVAHPRNIGKNEEGFYKEPSADEVSGGGSWWSKSDNILTFHRPSMPLDFMDTTCTLRSTKIKKQSQNGKPGMTTFLYDRNTGRYYEDGYNPLNDFVL